MTGKVTVGLASHWPRVTDTMVLHLRAQSLEEGDEHPYALLWSMVGFTFTLPHSFDGCDCPKIDLRRRHAFNGHFPGQPGLTGTRLSPFWSLLELRMMEMEVTAGAISSQPSDASTPKIT